MAQYLITNREERLPFERCQDETNRIIQNAKNILTTRMGEVPYDRLKGFDTQLYDLPFEDFLFELPDEIERIMAWEWRCSVVSADARIVRDDKGLTNGVLIEVVIEIGEEEE